MSETEEQEVPRTKSFHVEPESKPLVGSPLILRGRDPLKSTLESIQGLRNEVKELAQSLSEVTSSL